MSQQLPVKTNEELLRESINLLPPQTQILLKAYATKYSLDYKDENPVLWLSTAMTWWDTMKEKFQQVGITEDEASLWLVEELRKQEPWRALIDEDPIYIRMMFRKEQNE